MLLYKVVDIPVVGRASSTGRRHSLRGAEAVPHEQPDQQTIEVPLLLYTLCSTSHLCWSCRFSGAGSEEKVALPQFLLVEKSLFPDVQVVQFPLTSESSGTAPCGVTVHRRSGSALTG